MTAHGGTVNESADSLQVDNAPPTSVDGPDNGGHPK